MKPSNCIKLILIIFYLTTMGGCTSASQVPIPTGPDYSNNKYWSVQDNPQHDIDVFFVHPTTYGPPANGHFIADLDNAELNKVTDRDTINWITAAFSERCNIYAPRYRQMNIEVLKMADKVVEKYMNIAAEDIKAAFNYYLENINHGRPFILASHSQGSYALLTMLLKNPKILDKSKLVAAYLPGWTFTARDLSALGLELSEKPEQTGCLITWNTVGPGGISPTVKKGALCVNPLSWNTKKQKYPADMDLEAKIFISHGKQLLIKNFTAARINEQGALEIPTPKKNILKLLNMSLGKEVYHRYDYDFFFYNVKENVKTRCAAYLKEHQ